MDVLANTGRDRDASFTGKGPFRRRIQQDGNADLLVQGQYMSPRTNGLADQIKGKDRTAAHPAGRA